MQTPPENPSDFLSRLPEQDRRNLRDFLRVSDGSKESAYTEERLLTSMALAYRRLHTSN